jgi:AraC-like DNA-binding protein
MVDLVAHCGVAERTLRKHFRAFMGVSPVEYWRRFYLGAAREELLKGSNGGSVTEVAMRFGFNHLGRFSEQYHRAFGEKPSTTLRRGCIAERERMDRANDDAANINGFNAGRLRERPCVAVLPCQVSTRASELRCARGRADRSARFTRGSAPLLS